MEQQEDFTPSAPKLSQIAANTIITNSHRLLIEPRDLDSFSLLPELQQELRQEDVEAILRELDNFELVPDKEFFNYFTEGDRYPTSILKIGANPISDETFVNILVGQAKTLHEVNLHGNRSLGSRTLLDRLIKYKNHLPTITKLVASSPLIFDEYENAISESAKHFIEDPTDMELLPAVPSEIKKGPVDLDSAIHLTSFFPAIEHFRYTNVSLFTFIDNDLRL